MSIRKKSALGALIATTALALGACGGVDTGTGSTKSNEPGATAGEVKLPDSCTGDNPLVAVLLPNQTNPYYVAMKEGFEQGAEEYGFSVEVQIADDDDAQQLAQAEAVLQKKPCALALNPVKSEPAAAIVRAANDAGVPVFTVNVIVNEDALKAQNATIIQYLGADNKQGGIDIGKAMLEDMGADAEINVGLVTEPDEVPVVIRDEGFEEALGANAHAGVVASVDGNVKATDSLDVTGAMLQGNPTMNAIFASTGPATQGALEAVTASGTDVKVYGFCAPEIPTSDVYPACVAQEPADYGKRVVEQISLYVAGNDVDAEILRPLKIFRHGETPAPGEVG